MAIRYDKKLNNEINRVVKNFNQKIARLEKQERELLPAKISTKQLKSESYSRTDLRRKLKESDSQLKIYKNTLVQRALSTLDINLDEHLNGPKVVAFGKDTIEPIKTVSEFIKKHENLEMKVGIVDGKIAELDELKKLATIPSRDGLLTMFAGGLMQIAKDFAICVDLHAENLEENN